MHFYYPFNGFYVFTCQFRIRIARSIVINIGIVGLACIDKSVCLFGVYVIHPFATKEADKIACQFLIVATPLNVLGETCFNFFCKSPTWRISSNITS